MKTISIISFISILLFVPNIKAQNVAPLKLGNIWIYDENPSISRTTVIDTSVYMDTIAYCKLFRELNYGGLQYYKYARLRNDNFYVLFNEIDSTETHIYYKKNAIIGDSWTIGGTTVYTIADTFVVSVFGEPTTVKLLTRDNGLVYIQEYWTEKFGKLGSQDFGGVLDDLQGCVIDGIVYGDTTFTIVSIEDEREIPHNFYLAQNYPNPFNPVTKIKYSIPYVETRHASSLQTVTLKVYDLLGREVATLVNEEKPAGEYEVEFNAANLPSGIYFYQLNAGNFISTKKMILLK